MEPIIEIKHVSKTFRSANNEVTALKDIDLTINKGEIYGIIGLSGAGKSTLVRCLNYLEKPTDGEIFVHGQNLETLSNKELRKTRQNIGMIFQHFNLLMQRNVLENVCFSMEIAGVPKTQARERARELLKLVGLSEKEKAYPAQLSGGQKQRVAIARVLANNPEIILCDEATSALDPQTTKSILDLLQKINRELGITIVVITHEMSVVQQICGKVAVLEHGTLVENGNVTEIFRTPKSNAAKNLIFSAVSYTEQMRSENKVRLIFERESAYKPILANIILECKTPVNILYANTKTIEGKAVGEMILQLPEDEDTANRMIDYFKTNAVTVEEVETSV